MERGVHTRLEAKTSERSSAGHVTLTCTAKAKLLPCQGEVLRKEHKGEHGAFFKYVKWL